MHGSCAVDPSGFSRPLPVIGLYAAAASAICAVAMAYDAIYAVCRHDRPSYPAAIFSLNAATITLLSVATKFPLDLSSSMPSQFDQLAKLSGSALVAAAACHFHPSLDSVSDLIALAIFVATLMVDISIQVSTSVIYAFVPEHVALVVLNIALLFVLCSSALFVLATKRSLELKFQIYTDRVMAGFDDYLNITSLEQSVKKCWLMARSWSHQHVLGRSATCRASGFFGLMACVVLVEATLRSSYMSFCEGRSEYKRSAEVVFFSQLTAVMAGTVTPTLRLFDSVYLTRRCSHELGVESYWTQKLDEWKHDASFPWTNACGFKNLVFCFVVGVQIGLVVVCKTICSAARWIHCVVRALLLFFFRVGENAAGPRALSGTAAELRRHVQDLEGEEDDLVNFVILMQCNEFERLIKKGAEYKPSCLIELISNVEGYDAQNLQTFLHSYISMESSNVPLAVVDRATMCWELPLVTLTAITVALASIDPDSVRKLQNGVREGLKYVRHVEDYLGHETFIDMRIAAYSLWLGVDFQYKLLDHPLRRRRSANSKTIIEELKKFSEGNQAKSGRDTIIAKCVTRVTAIILQDYDAKYGAENGDRQLLEWLKSTIRGTLCACLTNLPHIFFNKSFCDGLQKLGKGVRETPLLLGETKAIIENLETKGMVAKYPRGKRFMEEWR
ncbi:uncharacterized protein LOC122014341 [Zingiber officinale]|uniref:Uncharacterized protein n=1 Tax=Zingiber officinale TaxID=94328 RepID=A0A8J5F306_ZINOF|nr:uncharacterized protein LOC122014341 [Zingiber officinale]KAG6481107.1 hypothetical protein ZIOFF_057699 [Zingiber officinale]